MKVAQTIVGAMTKPAATRHAFTLKRAIHAAAAIVITSRIVLSETQSATPSSRPAIHGAFASSAARASIQTAVQRLSVRYSSDFRKYGGNVGRSTTDHIATRSDQNRF